TAPAKAPDNSKKRPGEPPRSQPSPDNSKKHVWQPAPELPSSGPALPLLRVAVRRRRLNPGCRGGQQRAGSVAAMVALLLVGASLGLSNFAASVGIGVGGVDARARLRVGIIFGIFETAMPILGLL